MKIEINTLTSEAFLELYTSVGWAPLYRTGHNGSRKYHCNIYGS